MSRPRKTYWSLIWKQRLSNWLTRTKAHRRTYGMLCRTSQL